MISNNYERHNSFFQKVGTELKGYIDDRRFRLTQFWDYKEENERLHAENRRLLNQLSVKNRNTREVSRDNFQQYIFIEARVVNNSVNLTHNYLTLNKGSRDGVEPEMGIISPDGVVGIVTEVSRNYSLAISLLNINLGISARLSQNDYFGSLQWNGKDPLFASLKQIPTYVPLQLGDTITTSGFSAIFPPGMPIGLVEGYQPNRSTNFYTIQVRLLTQFRRLDHVYLIKNFLKKEQQMLESGELSPQGVKE